MLRLILLFGLVLFLLDDCTGPIYVHLSSSVTSASKVTLAWDATDSTVDGYNVYRSGVSGGPYSLVGRVDSVTLSYNDTNVVAGATYYYVATAYTISPQTESSYSNEVSATAR